MSSETNLEARVDALEVALAYQGATIEDLNRAVTEQWKIIDALKRAADALADRLQEAEQRARLGGPPEPPPPHY